MRTLALAQGRFGSTTRQYILEQGAEAPYSLPESVSRLNAVSRRRVEQSPACINISIYICISIYLRTYIYAPTYMYIYAYICMDMHVYVYIHIYAHTYMCIYVYVYIYI